MTDGSTSKKVFTDLLLQLQRWTAKGRSHHHDGGGTWVLYYTHLSSLLSWLSCRVEPKRLPVQNRVLTARSMKLTTDRHLVLKLRNNGIIPPLPPCTLMTYQGTALPVRVAPRTHVTCVVLIAVMWRIFFWDVTPYSLVDRYHRFEGTCCLCIQGKREDRWRWKPRCLCNTGISLHNDAASHSTRQCSCLNERAVTNFWSKWASEYVHKRRTINLFLNQEKTVAASD